MGKRKTEILTGVELGTSSIKVLMGEFLEDDALNVLGVAERPSLKIMKGEVLDAALVSEQLALALSEAEKASGEEIGQVFLAVTGGSVRSVSSVGSAVIHAAEHRITENDVITALNNARAYGLPPDKRVLHHMDRRYMVDGEREVLNPIGQVGGRLDADIQIVYGQHNSIETACRIVRDVMGYAATDIAFSGVAAGFGVFSPAEMARGSLVIDIGAGVTEYVLFHGPGVFHSGQIPSGANTLSMIWLSGCAFPCRGAAQFSRRWKGSGLRQ